MSQRISIEDLDKLTDIVGAITDHCGIRAHPMGDSEEARQNTDLFDLSASAFKEGFIYGILALSESASRFEDGALPGDALDSLKHFYLSMASEECSRLVDGYREQTNNQ